MIRNLDIDALRSLVLVAETMSFSRVAEQLGLSQSAVSLQIRRLEQRLGRRLLYRRQGRLLGITAEGQRLLPYARHILLLNDEAYATVCDPDLEGTVRLGVSPDFFERGLPQLISRFAQLHRRVQVEVDVDVSGRLRERTTCGELDLAFFKQPPGLGAGRAVSLEALVWAGRAATVVAHGDAPLPLVLLPEGCMFRHNAIMALDQAGMPWRPAMTCTSYMAIKTAVAAGVGITALATHLVPADLALSDKVPGLPALSPVELALTFAPNAHRPLAQRLADYLIDRLGISPGGPASERTESWQCD